jgi:hypothetical protein
MNARDLTFNVVRIDLRHLLGQWGDANQPNRDLLVRADAILGADRATGEPALFYGREMYEDVAAGRALEFLAKLQVVVSLDLSGQTTEAEFLVAAIKHLKGPGACCFGR